MSNARVPCVWVVASHRTLGNEHGHPQMYTVMDEAGTRTLLNMGLQPATFPGFCHYRAACGSEHRKPRRCNDQPAPRKLQERQLRDEMPDGK